MGKFFDEGLVFSAYDIQKWKPDPALFLYAAEKIGVAPNRCAVIEDSIAGIEAGIAAGMQTIGYSPDEDGRVTDRVSFVHSLAELIPHLS